MVADVLGDNVACTLQGIGGRLYLVFRIQVFRRLGVWISREILLEKQIGQRLQARLPGGLGAGAFLGTVRRIQVFQGSESFGLSERLLQVVVEELEVATVKRNGILLGAPSKRPTSS
jgi:hypothetical protein